MWWNSPEAQELKSKLDNSNLCCSLTKQNKRCQKKVIGWVKIKSFQDPNIYINRYVPQCKLHQKECEMIYKNYKQECEKLYTNIKKTDITPNNIINNIELCDYTTLQPKEFNTTIDNCISGRYDYEKCVNGCIIDPGSRDGYETSLLAISSHDNINDNLIRNKLKCNNKYGYTKKYKNKINLSKKELHNKQSKKLKTTYN